MSNAPNLKGRRSDLLAEVFLLLQEAFFDKNSTPVTYRLRDKRNTQDDPLDEYIHGVLSRGLSTGAVGVRAPGPLITPDLVVMRPDLCNGASRVVLGSDLTIIAAIEVKKLERTEAGTIARASGMDYNTTPPCGTVRVYEQSGLPLDIRGFYLFVCQEAIKGSTRRYQLSALVLCDGNLLNADFQHYLSIVGERRKQIGLGTYRDGANRSRPMLIFANPLGVTELDRRVTLIHPADDLARKFPPLRRVGVIRRSIPTGGQTELHCYRLRRDVSGQHHDFELVDPFPVPDRDVSTQPRGRFRLDIRPGD